MGENIICKRKWHYINKNNNFTGFYPEMVKIITEVINVLDPKVKTIFNDEIRDKVNRFKNLMGRLQSVELIHRRYPGYRDENIKHRKRLIDGLYQL